MGTAPSPELLKANKSIRIETQVNAKGILEDLFDRTTFSEVLFSKADSSKHWYSPIQMLQEQLGQIGVHVDEKLIKIVEVHGPDGGKLTSEETKSIYKARPNRKVFGKVQRIVKRFDTDDPALIFVYDSDGNLVLIQIQNLYTNDEIDHRSWIRNTFYQLLLEGWAKVCGLSGILNLPITVHIMNSDAKARKGYFGGKHEQYSEIEIVPTKGGLGTTAKGHYTNPYDEFKSFQIGNYLRRVVVECSALIHKRNIYIEKKLKVLCVVGDYISFPRDRKQRDTHRQIKPLNPKLENCSLAINQNYDGSGTPWCFHYDSKVRGACMVDGESGKKGVRLSSLDRNPGADAGELIHEVGGLTYGYGSRDAILFNGCHYHSPLMPSPCEEDSQPGRKRKNGTAQRLSYVMFRR